MGAPIAVTGAFHYRAEYAFTVARCYQWAGRDAFLERHAFKLKIKIEALGLVLGWAVIWVGYSYIK